MTRFRESLSLKLFIYCVLTLLVMSLHSYLPSHTKTLLPMKQFTPELFNDGLTSDVKAEWIDETQFKWKCTIPNDNLNHYCGFNLSLDPKKNASGINLSVYDRIRVTLEYKGDNQRLRFFTRSFIEGFTPLTEDRSRYQFSNVLILREYLDSELDLDLNEFTVAEWWINDFKVPRALMHTNFTRTTVVGVDLSYPALPGAHQFHLKKIELVGLWVSKEKWYLAILIFWIAVIMINGAYRLFLLNRKYRAEHQQLKNLIKENSSLAFETDHYKKLSMLDELTGLLNRHGLTQVIKKDFAGLEQRRISMIIIDIDFFKSINDTYGHSVGDVVLQVIAGLIREKLSPSDCAARWGGEEFVVLVDTCDLNAAVEKAESFRQLVQETNILSLKGTQVTISLGVGTMEEDEPFHLLFRKVDAALYRAKAQGRNRVEIADGADKKTGNASAIR